MESCLSVARILAMHPVRHPRLPSYSSWVLLQECRGKVCRNQILQFPLQRRNARVPLTKSALQCLRIYIAVTRHDRSKPKHVSVLENPSVHTPCRGYRPLTRAIVVKQSNKPILRPTVRTLNRTRHTPQPMQLSGHRLRTALTTFSSCNDGQPAHEQVLPCMFLLQSRCQPKQIDIRGPFDQHRPPVNLPAERASVPHDHVEVIAAHAAVTGRKNGPLWPKDTQHRKLSPGDTLRSPNSSARNGTFTFPNSLIPAIARDPRSDTTVP